MKPTSNSVGHMKSKIGSTSNSSVNIDIITFVSDLSDLNLHEYLEVVNIVLIGRLKSSVI